MFHFFHYLLNEKHPRLQLHFAIGNTEICINFIDASNINIAIRSCSSSSVKIKILFIIKCKKCNTDSDDSDILKF